MIAANEVKTQQVFLQDTPIYRIYLGDSLVYNRYIIADPVSNTFDADGTEECEVGVHSNEKEWSAS